MMNIIFNVVMCICVLPVLVIMAFLLYPKNWKKSKLIFGVTSRKEYTEGEIGDRVSEICAKRRSQALKVLIGCFILAVIIIMVRNFILMTTGWLLFTFGSIIAMNIPYILGNKEMKSLKKSLGLVNEKKVTFTDLNNVGSVRTLKISRTLPPNAIGFLTLVGALLVDLKVIPVDSGVVGTFVCTGGAAIFFLTEIIITVAAYILDGLKNEVISSDSAINANYNRAKKKNLSDFTVIFLWGHVLLLCGILVFNMLCYSMIGLLACMFIYIIILMAGIILVGHRDRKIENRYKKEMTISEDEDDNWIWGLFYYNPNNKRLNVKKRVGIGGTINLAHPVGKLVSVFIVLIILFSIGAMVYVGMAEATPIKLNIENEKIVCHHISDDYVIDFSSIEDISLGQDTDSLKFYKIAGFGMDNLLKGSFSVNGDGGCKVFLNPRNSNYIKIVADGVTYYIGSETPEETEKVFQTVIDRIGR